MLRPQHVEQKQPYVDDSCKLLLHCNGVSGNQQFIDSSNNPKVITTYGNACLSNTHYRFGGTSGYFATSGSDYLTFPNSSLGSSQITGLSCWFLTTSTGWGVMCDFFNSSNSETLTVQIYAGTTIYLRDVSLGTQWYKNESMSGLNNGTWHHMYLGHNGTSYFLYIDGVSKTLTSEAGSAALTASNSYIARRSDNSLTGFSGYLSEITIWKEMLPSIGMIYPQMRPYGYPIGGT